MNKKVILIVLGLLIGILICLLLGSSFFGTHEVVFDSKGGTSIAVQKVKDGSLVEKPNNPVLQGYLFDGWYLNDQEFDFNTPIKEDITLTGKWHSLLNE